MMRRVSEHLRKILHCAAVGTPSRPERRFSTTRQVRSSLVAAGMGRKAPGGSRRAAAEADDYSTVAPPSSNSGAAALNS
eukprot:6702467-Prymnesium_polylepis.1